MGTYNNANHPNNTLLASPIGGEQETENCNGNSSDSKVEFDVGSMDNNDEELHRETKEEEKIKLQESNVDLFARDHVSADAR